MSSVQIILVPLESVKSKFTKERRAGLFFPCVSQIMDLMRMWCSFCRCTYKGYRFHNAHWLHQFNWSNLKITRLISTPPSLLVVQVFFLQDREKELGYYNGPNRCCPDGQVG